MFHSARIKLTAWYVSALALFIAVLGAGVYLEQKSQLQSRINAGVESTARAVVSTVVRDPTTHAFVDDAPYTVVIALPRNNAYQPTDGTIIAPAAIPPAIENGHDERTVQTSHGGDRVYTIRVDSRGRTIAVVQVSRSLTPETEALENLLHTLLFGAVAAIALAAGGGWFLAGRALVPVRQAFDRQKAFVGDASHELRTPLAVIKANAEFLQQAQPDNAEVEDIVTEADRMSALVDSLLALARGETAETRQREQFDLGLVVETSVDTLKPLAEERRVTLAVRHDDADLRIDGNREQIKQLMVILLDNALRYTGQGGSVDVDVLRTDGTGVVRVSDTGIGISPSSINHVFDRFYRADEARNRDSGGVGLGLAIARELVVEHGGRIAVESSPGEGSTFTVHLPLA
jgi:signal transduction histidine kinase